MPNKPRPRCPSCKTAMTPLFRKRPRGSGFARAGTAFMCVSCDVMARGRGAKVKYLS